MITAKLPATTSDPLGLMASREEIRRDGTYWGRPGRHAAGAVGGLLGGGRRVLRGADGADRAHRGRERGRAPLLTIPLKVTDPEP